MRTLVHLSDLHFGRVDAGLLEPLCQRIAALQPDVVVVSGDLTQRARPAQFRAAREFLDRLPQPQIVVPGNHDVPLYNLLLRFVRPLGGYRRHISANVEPHHIDAEVAVVGMNTARSFIFKGGTIAARQLERLRARLCDLPPEVVRVVVTHHPLDLPAGGSKRDLVGRAPRAMALFARCGADLLLSGHMHAGFVGNTAARYQLGGYSALLVQASTATSTRLRGEVNSFNLIRIDAPRIEVQRQAWDPDARAFLPLAAESLTLPRLHASPDRAAARAATP